MAAPAALTAHLELIEAALAASLSDGPDELIQTSRYVMGWTDESGRQTSAGGKRIRPALCLFAAEIAGGNARAALPGAVAVELIHNFSLVHDEVQDHDAERHHRPTVWALAGEGQAINTGDFLITRAIGSLLSAAPSNPAVLSALDALNDAMAQMIAGQWADISFESRDAVFTVEYMEMVRGKTGALLGAPLAMGALLGGASAALADDLRKWGEAIGLAFQVQDDYLGIWGDPNITGKSNINDIVRKKKTLPVLFGLASEEAVSLRNAYAQPEMDSLAVTRVIESLERCGARDYTRAEGERLIERAGRVLERLELPLAAKRSMAEVGSYLVERDN
jgi:geranylgeranyl diphosphate synthase type I